MAPESPYDVSPDALRTDGKTKAGNGGGARGTGRDNKLDGEAADQLGWP